MIFRKYLCNPGLLKKELKRTKYIMILHTFVLLLCTSLPAVLENENAKQNMYSDATRDFAVLKFLAGKSPLTLMAVCAAAFGISYFLFSYMFNKKSVIFYGSMPEKKSCIFGTKLIVALLAALIPAAVTAAVNVMLALVMSVGGTGYILKRSVFIMFQYVFLIAAFSCAAAVSGNFLSMLTAAGFGFLAYPFLIAAIMGNVEIWLKTYKVIFRLDAFYVFPPSMTCANNPPAIKHIVFEILITVALICAGLLLCSKRKAENTGKFFVFRFVNSVIKYIASAIGAALFGCFIAAAYSGNRVITLATYIVFLFLIYVVLQALFEKNFKAMFYGMKKFVLFGAVFAVVVGIFVFDCFGFDAKVPDSANVVTIDASNNELHLAYSDYGYSAELKSPENVDVLLSLADKSVNKAEKHDDDGYYISMKIDNPPLGIYRGFLCDENDVKKCMAEIYDSAEYKKALGGGVDLLKHTDKYGDVGFRLQVSCSYYKSGDFNEKFVDGFKKVLKSDIEKYSYSDISLSSVFAYVNQYSENGGVSLTVYSCYEDTIDYLVDNYLFIPALEKIKIENPVNGKTVEISDLSTIKRVFRFSRDYYLCEDEPMLKIYADADEENTEAANTGTIEPVSGRIVAAGVYPDDLPQDIREKLE